jgi:hypothetical protein
MPPAHGFHWSPLICMEATFRPGYMRIPGGTKSIYRSDSVWQSASLRPHPVHTREDVDHNVGIFAPHWWNLLFLRTGGEELLLYISELQMHANPPASSGQRSFADVVEHMRDLQVRDATLAVTLSDLVAGESDGADVRLTRMAAIAAALEAGTQNTESLVRDFAGSLARTGESLRYYRRPQ